MQGNYHCSLKALRVGEAGLRFAEHALRRWLSETYKPPSCRKCKTSPQTFETCPPRLLRTPPILNVPELRIASGAGLARDLAQVVSEPIFDIPWLVEAARHQRFDPILRSGSTERSDACIPPSAELDIRRKAGVHEALGIGDRPFVEPGDPGCERL